MRAKIASALLVALPAGAWAQDIAGTAGTGPAAQETAGFEDYRTPAGRVEGGVLRVALDARPAAWQPWGADGPAIPAHTFTVADEPARVPGPLIRVSAGTTVQVSIRNGFGDTILVRGLRDRGQEQGAPANAVVGHALVVPPGATAEKRFTPTVPGTYFYFGRVLPAGWSAGPPPGLPVDGGDRAFIGVLIVDPPGAAPPDGERIFLITHWADRQIKGSWQPATRFMINGRSWPHTERLQYTQGDTVRWRVVNMSGRAHPMHLHGFYFRVDARGDQAGEIIYPPGERRLAVTEVLQPAETMRLTWVPEEPGNWIFHCHLMRHMSWLQTSPLDADAPAHVHERAPGQDPMGGLVLGITVRPRAGYAPAADVSRRRMALHIGMRPGVFGDEPAYGFVLQDGAVPPAPDSVRFPGSTLVLTRGQPTEIVVHNRADVPLGVHWHGLELESWADGVPGWSGAPGATRPAISPGDSFAVRMTPPRAGTFMYHVHSEPGHQLAQGLYGAFLVMEPGRPLDPDTDRIFLLGSLGAGLDPPPAVNGTLEPGPVELRAGIAYRLRFMHISPDDDKRVSLLYGEEPAVWTPIAKDGADLPPSQLRSAPAELGIHVGETYDVVWTPPRAGEFTLRIVTTFDRGAPAFPRDAPPPHTMDIPVIVR